LAGEIEYFLDFEGKRKPAVDKEGHIFLQFGRVVTGKESSMALYMKNKLDDNIVAFYPHTSDPDLVISSHPPSLMPGQVDRMEIAFRPKAERRTPLKNATWWYEIDIG
jgi:hypothetical protein